MSSTTGMPPAGWYADSSAPGQERWWDGRSWTDHSRPQRSAHDHRPSAGGAIRCPRCGSGDAKALRVIRQQGTSTGTGTSTGWVQGNGSDPGHSVTMTTRTTTYTDAALAAAPPRKRENAMVLLVAGPIIGVIVGWIGWYLATSNTFGTVAINLLLALIIGFAIMAIGMVLLPGDLAFNREDYPRMYERWSRSWACQRCGEVFAV